MAHINKKDDYEESIIVLAGSLCFYCIRHLAVSAFMRVTIGVA